LQNVFSGWVRILGVTIPDVLEPTPTPVPPLTATLLWEMDTRGDGEGEFDNPRGVAVGPQGNVYIVDRSNKRVQVFSPTGEFLRAWTTQRLPGGIAVDASGNVYVAGRDERIQAPINYRVQVFNRDGDLLRRWDVSRGEGDGQFGDLEGIAVDAAGNLYMADAPRSFGDAPHYRVQVFSPAGEFLRKWGSQGTGDGQFSRPVGIAVDAAGNVYVTGWNGQVQVFSPTGEFLRKWRTDGDGIAVDGAGRVYVADNSASAVKVFSRDGEFLYKWRAINEIGIRWIAVDREGDKVYVVDTDHDRVRAFIIEWRP
jgi:DNA-binding beta-propeller fold protein YncE